MATKQEGATARKVKAKAKGTRVERTVQSVQENGEGVAVVQLATRVPRNLFKTLKLYGVQTDKTVSDLITEAITDLLAKHKVIAKKAA